MCWTHPISISIYPFLSLYIILVGEERKMLNMIFRTLNYFSIQPQDNIFSKKFSPSKVKCNMLIEFVDIPSKSRYFPVTPLQVMVLKSVQLENRKPEGHRWQFHLHFIFYSKFVTKWCWFYLWNTSLNLLTSLYSCTHLDIINPHLVLDLLKSIQMILHSGAQVVFSNHNFTLLPSSNPFKWLLFEPPSVTL